MSARLLDGRVVAGDMCRDLRHKVAQLNNGGVTPGVAVLQMGQDFGAESYSRAIRRECGGLGIQFQEVRLEKDATASALIEVVETLNADPSVSGILPMRPFPSPECESMVGGLIDPAKDVDCQHPVNLGRVAQGSALLVPPTAEACMRIIERTMVEEGSDPAQAFAGAQVCVVGHSAGVGKPVALLALARDATVSVTHIYTSRRGMLADYTRRAEYLIVAAGVPLLIGPDEVREGAVVVDVGINGVRRCEKCGVVSAREIERCAACGTDLREVIEEMVGDVDLSGVKDKVRAITPVPGGVGSVTNAVLLANVVTAACIQAGLIQEPTGSGVDR